MKLARKNNLLAALLAAVMMLTVILGGCSSAPSSQVPESSVPESSAAPDSSVPESSQEPSSDPEPVNNPEISEHAMAMADLLCEGLKAKGYTFGFEPETNQIFPILPNQKVEELQKEKNAVLG